MYLLQILSENTNCTYLCYHELNLQTQEGGKICRKNIFSIIGELELKLLAVIENY